MNLQETIRKVLRETKEEKIRSFLFSRFDRVFNELNLEVEYDKEFVNTMYGKWFNEKNDIIFHRNNWGALWVKDCDTYRKLRSYSISVLLNLEEFNNLLIEYLNDRYSNKFKGKILQKVGDEYHCLKNSHLRESEVTEKWSEKYKKSINCNNPKGFSQKAHCQGKRKHSEMKEGELTERCWAGYTQKGMKTMFGKRYPNCVKKTKK